MYDDFTWMEKFGDPMFQRHVAMASVLGLVALRLADEEFLPFNYVSYALELMVTSFKNICSKQLVSLPAGRNGICLPA